jgi:hypothetical protein
MVFNKRNVNEKFMFNNNEIENVHEYKYVGAIMSSNTRNVFKNNSNHLVKKARRALFGLNAQIKDSVGHLPCNHFIFENV